MHGTYACSHDERPLKAPGSRRRATDILDASVPTLAAMELSQFHLLEAHDGPSPCLDPLWPYGSLW